VNPGLLELIDDDSANNRSDDGRAQVRPAALGARRTIGLRAAGMGIKTTTMLPATIRAAPVLPRTAPVLDIDEIVECRSLRLDADHGKRGERCRAGRGDNDG